MKYIKWKILIVTCAVCLLPILLGVILWNDLPDLMAIHFNFKYEPDNFASKTFVVFALPFIMALLQVICCFINDFNAYKHGNRVKFERATKWLIPVMSIILQTTILIIGLGKNVNVRVVTALIVGGIFLVIGKYLPEFDYNVDAEKAVKINKFIGCETVIMGVLMLITIFLPPFSTAIWFALLIPYTLIGIIYGIIIGKK